MINRRLGLFAAIAIAMPAAGSSAAPPKRLTIELSSFSVTPKLLTLTGGEAYQITLVNKSGRRHDFTASAFFDSVRIVRADQGKIAGGRVRLGGGQLEQLLVVPLRPGLFEFHCSHAFHALLGMRRLIRVI